jgi:hypothetical protein
MILSLETAGDLKRMLKQRSDNDPMTVLINGERIAAADVKAVDGAIVIDCGTIAKKGRAA